MTALPGTASHAHGAGDGPMLWQASLVGAFAELGDKNFFLLVILAAWCPLRGFRRSGLQRCFVAAGAGTALSLSACLRLAARSTGGRLASVDKALYIMSATMFVVLALRAITQLLPLRRPHGPAAPLTKAEQGAAALAGVAAPMATSYNSPPPATTSFQAGRSPAPPGGPPAPGPAPAGGFLGSFQAYDPSAYAKPSPEGAEPQLTTAANPFGGADYGAVNPKAEPQRGVSPMFIAFAVSFAAVFVAQVGDKSQQVLLAILGSESSSSPIMVLATLAGFLVATIFAVLAGYILERQLSDERLLFVVSFGLMSLALISISQATLQFFGPSAWKLLKALIQLPHEAIPAM